MSRREFLSLELPELIAVLKAVEDRNKSRLLRDANFLCALLAPHRDPKKPPIKPEDFLPKTQEERERKASQQLSKQLGAIKAMAQKTRTNQPKTNESDSQPNPSNHKT